MQYVLSAFLHKARILEHPDLRGGHLDELVLRDVLHRQVQVQLEGRHEFGRFVAPGGAHVRELLRLAHVHLQRVETSRLQHGVVSQWMQ